MKGNQELYQALLDEINTPPVIPEGAITIKKLSDDLGCCINTSRERIKELLASGRIRYAGSVILGGGSGRPTKYYFVNEKDDIIDETIV